MKARDQPQDFSTLSFETGSFTETRGSLGMPGWQANVPKEFSHLNFMI